MHTLAALLVTDVVASTELNDRHGDAMMAQVWAEHDRLARDLVRRWQGREIGRSDGIVVLFDEVVQALDFARDYHAALAGLQVPLSARAGIHAGPIALRENSAPDRALGATRYEVDGIVLPVATRVMALAGGGRTLLTAVAAAAAHGRGTALQGLGNWRLKGLTEPIELFAAPGAMADAGIPLDSATGYRVTFVDGDWLPAREIPHRLPAERRSFVGRAVQLDALAQAFDAGARLVTLTGTGGVGKTRVALRYARRWLGEYPGGAWFCDLSEARNEQQLLQAVARGLDVPLGQEADLIGRLLQVMDRRGRCLLVLDNFEQLAGHAEKTLGAWLGAAEAHFLVTSRAALGIAGEHLHELPPLPKSEAVQLFQRRALDAGASEEEPRSDDRAVEALVELLDRVPLALELAAARARLLSPPAMLVRMQDRFRLLARAPHGNARQATLRGTIDWSWQLLDPAEQAVLAQLSLFVGGFGLVDAEQIVRLPAGDDSLWVGDLLESLLVKSLLVKTASDRFGLLRSIQDYAAERLAETGGAGAAQRRHWLHFAALDEASVMNQRFGDLGNVVEACRRATAAGDAGAAVRALVVAAAELQIVGPVRLALELAEASRTLVQGNDAYAAAVDRVAGNAFMALGQRCEAQQSFEAGLANARSAGDARLTARLCCAMADLLTRSGDRDRARSFAGEAARRAAEVGDAVLCCTAANAQGALALAESRLDDAMISFKTALDWARTAAHRHWEAGLLGNLGTVHYLLGRPDEAVQSLRQSLSAALDIGDRQWAANARCNLGLLLQEQGQSEAAREELDAALIAARDIGHSLLEATVLCNLGLLLLDLGDAGQAALRLKPASEIADRIQDAALGAQCQHALARAHDLRGKLESALAAAQHAEALAIRAGDRAEGIRILCTRLRVERRAGLAQSAQSTITRLRALAASQDEHARDGIEREIASAIAAAHPPNAI